jgi:hypothetical protein
MLLVPNQLVDLNLKLKVLKAFAVEDTIYYVVQILQANTPLQYMQGLVWGVLRCDGTSENIPQDVFEKAARIVEDMTKG